MVDLLVIGTVSCVAHPPQIIPAIMQRNTPILIAILMLRKKIPAASVAGETALTFPNGEVTIPTVGERTLAQRKDR